MIEWQTFDSYSNYEQSISKMESTVKKIICGEAQQQVWLLEYNPLFTAGTSSKTHDLIKKNQFPIYSVKRGGQYTYHGPGQRIIYVMLDLKKRDQDIRKFVRDMEEWVIRTLLSFNVIAERREGRVGLWVAQGAPTNPAYRENKIAAIGVRVRKWVTFHGISINVDPDLSHFDGIVPCGISEHGVTSLWDLGTTASLPDVDAALRQSFEEVFGRRTVREKVLDI